MELTGQRHFFEIPSEVSYFNSAYMGPPLRAVVVAGRAGLDRRATPWTIQPGEFFSQTDEVRSKFAHLIGASSEDVAIISSASYGLAVAAKNLRLKANQEALIPKNEFPSVYYFLEQVCRRDGAKIKIVEPRSGQTWTESLVESIHPNTGVVALSPTHWMEGVVLDCQAVSERCRRYGVPLVIDGCQTLGAVPFDVKLVRPSFVVAPTYKWLLGPYRFGFLYVDPQYHDGQPLEEAWPNRVGSENFSELTNYQSAYRPGALRFDMGERSDFMHIPMAIAALDQIAAWTPEGISRHLRQLNDVLSAKAQELGFGVPGIDERSPHILSLRRQNGFTDKDREALRTKGVFASLRGDCLRLSPHLHIGDQDVQRLVEALELLR